LRKSTEYKKGQELVTFLVFYNGKQPIKLKQDIIAYFMEEGNKVKIVLFKGSPIIITDDLYTVKEWADMLNFIPVTPSLHVAHAAIKGYQQLEDDEIQVQIEPALPYKVISRGDEAAMVKMLFARELPKLE
jgi:DNA-binding LytR/AlgR family response regulator